MGFLIGGETEHPRNQHEGRKQGSNRRKRDELPESVHLIAHL